MRERTRRRVDYLLRRMHAAENAKIYKINIPLTFDMFFFRRRGRRGRRGQGGRRGEGRRRRRRRAC